MSSSQPELYVFNKLSEETITKLVEFFDEGILTTPPDESEIKKIVGDDFTDRDIEKIISAFFNFIRSKIYPEKILKIIDETDLEQDKKTLLKKTIQKIHDKTSLDNISTRITANFLQTFGFPHTHGITAVTEFRPISETSKIKKFIPSLVVSIKTHNSDNNRDDIVNLQLRLETIEEFIKTLNEGAESLKTEIQEIRNKFGDEIID